MSKIFRRKSDRDVAAKIGAEAATISCQYEGKGPPSHPYVPRNGAIKQGGKPATSRGHVKRFKGKACKNGRKDQYDYIVNIDLAEWQLTDDQVAEFKEVFMLFDKDEDGVLTFPELEVVMKSLGQRPSENELLTMVRQVSEDQIYDTIEFNEFLQMMSKQRRERLSEDSLKDAFKIFDKDDDGFISVEELRHIMLNLGDKMTDRELNDMLEEADSYRGNGLFNYQEFVQVLCGGEGPSGLVRRTKGQKKSKDRCTKVVIVEVDEAAGDDVKDGDKARNKSPPNSSGKVPKARQQELQEKTPHRNKLAPLRVSTSPQDLMVIERSATPARRPPPRRRQPSDGGSTDRSGKDFYDLISSADELIGHLEAADPVRGPTSVKTLPDDGKRPLAGAKVSRAASKKPPTLAPSPPSSSSASWSSSSSCCASVIPSETTTSG